MVRTCKLFTKKRSTLKMLSEDADGLSIFTGLMLYLRVSSYWRGELFGKTEFSVP